MVFVNMIVPFLAPLNVSFYLSLKAFMCVQKSRINAFNAFVVLANIERLCYNTILKDSRTSLSISWMERSRRDTEMPTAVVVATIVNTSMSEAGFRQHVVEQLRVNDRSLMDRLADADGDANVVTAVLNVEEFLAYLIRRFPKAVDAAISTGFHDRADAAERIEKSVDAAKMSDKMSEGEFMTFVSQQLEAGEIEPSVRFTDEDWDDHEDIGEDISRYPFFY